MPHNTNPAPWSLKRGGHSLQEGSEEGVKLAEGWEDQGAQQTHF